MKKREVCTCGPGMQFQGYSPACPIHGKDCAYPDQYPCPVCGLDRGKVRELVEAVRAFQYSILWEWIPLDSDNSRSMVQSNKELDKITIIIEEMLCPKK